jgi:hypothetical protein
MKYATPQSFRAALEERQKRRATDAGLPFDRIAQIDLYFRLMDRVLKELGNGVLVKGGIALELRLQRARTTGDIDLRAAGDPAKLLERLRRAGKLDLGDFLSFDVDERTDVDRIDGDGVIYEGKRLWVQAFFAGKPYRQRFRLDVAFGDPLVGAPDEIEAPDALSFINIPPPKVPLYPVGTHLAEKVHAYTLPRKTVNSRMKDLIDMALVAAEAHMQPFPTKIRAAIVREALETTFGFRKTHDLPSNVPPPPEQWSSRYPREKDLNDLPWATIADVHAEAARFLDPVLARSAVGTWEPNTRTWVAPAMGDLDEMIDVIIGALGRHDDAPVLEVKLLSRTDMQTLQSLEGNVERQNRVAVRVAEILAKRPSVTRVIVLGGGLRHDIPLTAPDVHVPLRSGERLI